MGFMRRLLEDVPNSLQFRAAVEVQVRAMENEVRRRGCENQLLAAICGVHPMQAIADEKP